jgi:LacI family transcriptional regulator
MSSEQPDRELFSSTRPGMKEVAERAGVAMSSVSRVLSGHPDVSPRMREVVMAAVNALGYRPDMLAQGLRRGKTFSVGFAVSDISNPVLAQAVTGAERRLREEGYNLLLTNSEGDPELDLRHVSVLLSRRVDGLLLSLADEAHPATIFALKAADVPVVLVDRDIPAGANARSVDFDHAAGMRDAVTHLVELGHRRVAVITGGPARPARQRLGAVREVLGRAGAELIVNEGPFTVEQGRLAVEEILRLPARPTAIIAGGNMLMHGALLGLRAGGVAVGAEMSFVGCDDVPVAELHTPPIAVVTRDMYAIGRAAAEVLLLQFTDEPDGSERTIPGHPDVTLPTMFVARASCAPPPH